LSVPKTDSVNVAHEKMERKGKKILEKNVKVGREAIVNNYLNAGYKQKNK